MLDHLPCTLIRDATLHPTLERLDLPSSSIPYIEPMDNIGANRRLIVRTKDDDVERVAVLLLYRNHANRPPTPSGTHAHLEEPSLKKLKPDAKKTVNMVLVSRFTFHLNQPLMSQECTCQSVCLVFVFNVLRTFCPCARKSCMIRASVHDFSYSSPPPVAQKLSVLGPQFTVVVKRAHAKK